MKKIVLTGCGGKVGYGIVEGLKACGKYEIVATSRRADPEKGMLALDVRDLDACIELTRGADSIIHCAYYMGHQGREGFAEHQVPSNVVGTYNIYEAARINGVRRVIFCSSNHTVGFYKPEEMHLPIREDAPYNPDSFYGLTKCFCEQMGHYYANRYDLSCVNLRIGNLSYANKPASRRTSRIYLSHRDLIQLLTKSIEAPDELKYDTFWAVSDNTDGYFDLSHAKEVLCYEPLDNGADLWEGSDSPDFDDTGYLGGEFVNY